MFTDVGSSYRDISFGSLEGLPVGTTPPHPAHVAMQHGFPPYHSSPIPLSYPRSGTSQSTNQILRSLMESQNKVLRNVSQHIDDLEQLVQAVTSTSTEGNASSSLNAAKARVPSPLTVRNNRSYTHVYFMILFTPFQNTVSCIHDSYDDEKQFSVVRIICVLVIILIKSYLGQRILTTSL